MKTSFSILALTALTITTARAQITPLDSTFTPNLDGNVNVITSAGVAGSYYVAGDFTQVDSTARTRIARIAPNGSLDTAFDPGTSANAAIYTLLTESGGGVLVGGGFTLFNGSARPALCRLTATGSVDSAISTTATVITTMAVNASKLYAAGNFPRSDAPGQYSFRIVRMAYPTGFTGNNYDPSYTEPTITGTVNALFFQLDGKLVIGGDFTAVNGTSRTNLARLNTDGSLDTTFTISATGGAVRTLVDFAPGAGAVAVGGEFTALGGLTSIPYYGVINLSTNGVVTTSQPRSAGPVRSILAYGNGDLLLGGDFTFIGTVSVSRMARVNVYDGTVAPALNINPNASVRAMLKDDSAQQRIVIGGVFTQVHTTPRNHLARLEPYGATQLTWPEATGGEVRAIAVQTNDAALIGGAFTALGGSPRTSLGRILVNDTLDASYTPNLDGPVNAIAALPNARALIGGSFTTAGGGVRANLARLNSDGTVDVTFTADTDGEVFAITQLTDGKVYVGGDFTTIGGIARRGVARLNADGTVDTTFDAALDGAAMTIAVQVDGKVLIGGDFLTVGGTSHERLARVSSTGALDATFVATAGGTVRTLNLDASGRVLAGGSFSTGSSFAQAWTVWLTSTGTTAPASVTFVNNAMRTSAILSDGTTQIGGQFSTASDGSSTSTGPLARLVGAKVSPTLPMNTGAVVRAMAARSDGALIVGGSFTSLGDVTRSNLGLWANAESAVSSFTVNVQTGAMSWARAGSTPSPTLVVFEVSTDTGASWTTLGIGGTPTISGSSWVNSLSTSTLPLNVAMQVRARGLVSDGVSSSWITSTLFSGIRQLPTITTQPVDQTVNQNTAVTLMVAATSSTGMTYQWRKDGNPITGATNSSYTFTASNVNLAGIYSVVITNANGSTTSNDAVLTIRPVVSIVTQPVSVTVAQGTSATFTVVAAGDSPTYQWQEYRYGGYPTYNYQWFNIAGATSASWSTTTSTIYQIRVTVSNAFSSVSSNSVSATVVAPPSISGEPYDVIANVGDYIGLGVSLSYSPADRTYQWFKDDAPISGVTSSSFSKTAALSDTGTYKVVITNMAGSTSSRLAQVRILPSTAPNITQQPVPLMLALGTTGELKIQYEGKLPLSPQWKRNGATLFWAAYDTLGVGSSMADSGLYSCTVTNPLGSAVSRLVNVAVVDTGSSTLSLPLHGTATIKAPTTAIGVTYRWQRGGTDLAASSRISGTTAASLVIKNLALDDAGAYTCVIGNAGSTLTGGVTTLIVQDRAPTVTTTALTAGTVAASYDATVAATHLPTKFTITGLPTGLRYDAATGHITGEPRANGTFPVKITATNGVGTGAAKTLSLTVSTMPAGVAASYIGINTGMWARMDATIATSGKLTGTVKLNAKNYPFTTDISQTDVSEWTVRSFQFTAPGFGLVTVTGKVAPSQAPGQLSFTFSYPDTVPGNPPLTFGITTWSLLPAALAAPFKGYYTASISPSSSIFGGETPEGSGYAAITVGSTGSTTVSGRLADGSAHSTSGFVGLNGEVVMFNHPIAGKSVVGGVLAITVGTAPNYYDSTVAGGLEWYRFVTTGRLYSTEFGQSLSVNGTKYLKTNLGVLTGPIVMNLPNVADNAALGFTASSESLYASSVGRISTANAFTLKAGGSFSSASVSINAATGVFSATGTFVSNRYSDGVAFRRSGTGYGIIVSRPATLGGQGTGYVIMPRIPADSTQTLSTTAQVSATLSLNAAF